MQTNVYLSKDKQSYFWIDQIYVEVVMHSHERQVRVEATQRPVWGFDPDKKLYTQMSVSAEFADSEEALSVLCKQMAMTLGNEEAYLEIYKLLTNKKHSVSLKTGGVISSSNKPSVGADSRISSLPGINEVVKHPVTGIKTTLSRVIQNLNDGHGWTREQIADWVETLDIDIEFKDTPPEPKKPMGQMSYDDFKSAYISEPKKSDHSVSINSVKDYLKWAYGKYPNHLHVAFDTNTNAIKAQGAKITPTTKKLIDDGVVKPTDQWYTLGHTDQLEIEYINPEPEEIMAGKYVMPKPGKITINDVPIEMLEIYYGGQIDKD